MTLLAAPALLPASVAWAGAHHTTSRHQSHHMPSGSAVSEKCPTAAVVSATLGATYPAPRTSSAAGMLSCNYNNPDTGADALLGFAKTPGMSAGLLKSTSASEARSQGVTARPVNGFGDGAYLFTQHDAGTDADGVATTVLLIQSGSTLVDITADAPPAKVEALGHILVG